MYVLQVDHIWQALMHARQNFNRFSQVGSVDSLFNICTLDSIEQALPDGYIGIRHHFQAFLQMGRCVLYLEVTCYVIYQCAVVGGGTKKSRAWVPECGGHVCFVYTSDVLE
jgi:hypothetical protein